MEEDDINEETEDKEVYPQSLVLPKVGGEGIHPIPLPNTKQIEKKRC